MSDAKKYKADALQKNPTEPFDVLLIDGFEKTE